MRNLLLLLSFFISINSYADAGPKPGMDFTFKWEDTSAGKALHGYQLESMYKDFHQFDTLQALGPQGFNIKPDGNARSLAYGYAGYHKLSILFEDNKVRTSNVFSGHSSNAQFTVIVKENELQVKETPVSYLSYLIRMLIALAFTIAIEAVVSFLYLKKLKIPALQRRGFIKNVTLLNLITLPLLWLAMYFTNELFFVVLIIGEILVLAIEATVLVLRHRKWLATARILAVVFLSNLLSFVIGCLVAMVLYMLI